MRKKSLVIVLFGTLFLFFLVTSLLIGILIGRGSDQFISLFSAPTSTITVTPSPSPSPSHTPTHTQTATATKTLLPTFTFTPTLAPGEFPYSADMVRNNYLNDLGLNCLEPTKSEMGGFFWDCRGRSGINILRVIFYGEERQRIDFIYSYSANMINPSSYDISFVFSLMTRNVFLPNDRDAIDQVISESLKSLASDEIVQIEVNGYSITISGASICSVLMIGEYPPSGIDRDIVVELSSLESFCFLYTDYYEENIEK